MRAVMVLGVLICAASAHAQETKNPATCRADRRGAELITTIQYANGYAVEGPWKVTRSGEEGVTSLTAVLDRIVEKQPFTKKPLVTALPGPVEMTFRGHTVDEVLNEAAHVWCLTVMEARTDKAGSTPLQTDFNNQVRIM